MCENVIPCCQCLAAEQPQASWKPDSLLPFSEVLPSLAASYELPPLASFPQLIHSSNICRRFNSGKSNYYSCSALGITKGLWHVVRRLWRLTRTAGKILTGICSAHLSHKLRPAFSGHGTGIAPLYFCVILTIIWLASPWWSFACSSSQGAGSATVLTHRAHVWELLFLSPEVELALITSHFLGGDSMHKSWWAGCSVSHLCIFLLGRKRNEPHCLRLWVWWSVLRH